MTSKNKNSEPQGELIQENILRKKLANNPDDIASWVGLFQCLIPKFNFNEINLLVEKAIHLNPDSFSIKKVCFYALIHALNIKKATTLAESDEFIKSIGSDEIFKNHLYFLGLINQIKGNLKCNQNYIPKLPAKEFITYNNSLITDKDKHSIDVVFFLKESFHISIQLKIAKKIRDLGLRAIFTDELWVVLYLKPTVLIFSEVFHKNFGPVRSLLPNTLFVNTRHGLADKNYLAVGASATDKICVSSESIANFFINNLLIDPSKIWITGYPQIDDFFSSLDNAKKMIKNEKSKIVLFAPTYTSNLNCFDLIKNQSLTQLIRGDNENIRIIIKPHPLLNKTNPNLLNLWKDESKDYANVEVINDNSVNLFNLFNESDLLISDLSTAALAWTATKKPLIQFLDLQALGNSEQFDKNGIEYRLIEASILVTDPKKLKNAVIKYLHAPSEALNKLEKFADFLFGNLRDGKSSERIALNVLNYIQSIN